MGCELGHTNRTCIERVTPCTEPYMCKYYREKMPAKVCVREIKELQKESQAWFKLLVEDCEYHKDTLCHVPLHVHPIVGLLVCKMKNCPLI